MFRTAVALAAFACAGDAVAQTSNCTSIGGGMVHCDNMGTNGSSSSTSCTSIGGGMTTCNTTGTGTGTGPVTGQPQRDGATTLSFIGGLIAQSQERSFQKKITQMLSSGDCPGAANFAFAKGRYDMSNQIRRSCAPAPAKGNGAATIAPTDLEAKLQLSVAKANAALPMAWDDMTTISKAEAIGSQVLLTATVNADGMTISEPLRTKVENEICANWNPALLKAGASIRIKYFERSGKEIGSVMVTRAECGL